LLLPLGDLRRRDADPRPCVRIASPFPERPHHALSPSCSGGDAARRRSSHGRRYPTLVLYPRHLGAETARYDHGSATISLRSPTATVEIRPLPVEKGQVAFSLAVFNHGPGPANLGIENISATVNGIPVPLPSHAQLAEEAERKARNAKIGTALFAGVLAGVASTASNEGTYYRHVRGPRGSYTQAIHWHDDMPGVIGATAAVAGGAMVIKGIDRKLDYTLAQLGTQVLQTTTIDPDSSFGGMVILPLGHRAAGPADIRVSIRFDGRPYLFGFTWPRPAWRRRPIFPQPQGPT
jgi:hypothetical protein